MTYTYDVFDRRIAQTTDADGAGPQSPETTRFVYHGAHVWADFDAAGNVTARYLFGQNIDELLARYRPGEGTAWYLTDHLGTVRDIVNAAGAVINHLDYDSFGQLLSQTNPPAGDRYTYTGREYDAALGQYYYRARFYDPRLGRFTSEDPLGFAAGDANLYRYVGNSPLNWIDPWGHVAVAERGAVTEFGPVLAFLRDPFTHCFIISFVTSSGMSIGMDYILAPSWGLPAGRKSRRKVSLDFAFSAISCRLFPPAIYNNATFGAVAVSIMAILTRAATVSAASKAVMLTTGHVLAYATSSGGGSSGAGVSGGGSTRSGSSGGGGGAGSASSGGTQGVGAPNGAADDILVLGRGTPDQLSDVAEAVGGRVINNPALVDNPQQLWKHIHSEMRKADEIVQVLDGIPTGQVSGRGKGAWSRTEKIFIDNSKTLCKRGCLFDAPI